MSDVSDGTTDLTADAATPRPRRWWFWVVLGSIAVAVVVVVVAVASLVGYNAQEDRALPSFPSLAAHPDPSLRGTVAYYDDASRCVRLVAASGSSSKQVWCLPAEGPSTWLKVGKPVGPQLVWRPDGRLEVTMFRMSPDERSGSAPPLTRGWQKLVDVDTGAVEDVPTAQVPSQPDESTRPVVNERGERLTTDFDGSTGRATVKLTTASGTRTLLSVHGPPKYGYRFGPVFWAPGGEWIAASDDGRILVIDPTDPAVTRVLVTGTGAGAGGGTEGPTFAVTSADLVTASP